jgi:hypothetical protein
MDNDKFKEDMEDVKSYTNGSNYEKAFSFLIERVKESRRADDQIAVDKYSAMARGILVLVESEFGATRMKPKDPSERHCSFCGKNGESKLIAGAEALICRNCSELIYETFNDPENT